MMKSLIMLAMALQWGVVSGVGRGAEGNPAAESKVVTDKDEASASGTGTAAPASGTGAVAPASGTGAVAPASGTGAVAPASGTVQQQKSGPGASVGSASGPAGSGASTAAGTTSGGAGGKAAFNPNDYIQKREMDAASAGAAAEVKEGQAVVDGVRYRVFKSQSGQILVPHVDRFTAADLDKATCAQGTSGARAATLGRAERPLTKSSTAYAEVIQQTILARCQGDGSPQPSTAWEPKGEIGVRIKDSDKPGSPSVKIYNDGLKPNVGVGAEF